MSVNVSLKKRFKVTSIGELQTPNKACGVAKIKREKLEDRATFSLVEVLHLSIHFLYFPTINLLQIHNYYYFNLQH
jgi:hypothetical protein